MKSFLCATVACLLSSYSLACDCIARPMAQLYAEPDVIFLGEVIRTTELCKSDAATSCGGPTAWLVRPYEVLKQPWTWLGTESTGLKDVFVIQDASNCSWPMKVGGKYLIFAKGVMHDVYSTNMCMGTTDAGRSEKMLAKLRQLRAAFAEAEKP